MLNKAIAKIKEEMDKNKDDSMVQDIGEFLLRQLEQDPAAADKIMAKDKTIIKSINEIESVARKKAKNNRARLSDAEGFAIVLKHFDIKAAAITPAAPQVTEPASVPEKQPDDDFSFNLADML